MLSDPLDIQPTLAELDRDMKQLNEWKHNPVEDYAPPLIEISIALTHLRRSLPMSDMPSSQRESARLLRAAQSLHEWIVGKI